MSFFNLLHWVLFFNQPKALEFLLNRKSEQDYKFLFGMAFAGDQSEIKFNFEYDEIQENKTEVTRNLAINKLGVIVCVL